MTKGLYKHKYMCILRYIILKRFVVPSIGLQYRYTSSRKKKDKNRLSSVVGFEYVYRYMYTRNTEHGLNRNEVRRRETVGRAKKNIISVTKGICSGHRIEGRGGGRGWKNYYYVYKYNI